MPETSQPYSDNDWKLAAARKLQNLWIERLKLFTMMPQPIKDAARQPDPEVLYSLLDDHYDEFPPQTLGEADAVSATAEILAEAVVLHCYIAKHRAVEPDLTTPDVLASHAIKVVEGRGMEPDFLRLMMTDPAASPSA